MFRKCSNILYIWVLYLLSWCSIMLILKWRFFFSPFVLLLDFLSGFETPSVLILSQPRYSAGLTVSLSLLVRSWVQHPRHGVKILVFWLLMWVVFLFELKERRIIWLAGRQRLLSFSFSLLQQPLPVQHLAGQEFNTVACLDSCKPQKLLSKQARGVFMCERDGTGRDGGALIRSSSLPVWVPPQPGHQMFPFPLHHLLWLDTNRRRGDVRFCLHQRPLTNLFSLQIFSSRLLMRSPKIFPHEGARPVSGAVRMGFKCT